MNVCLRTVAGNTRERERAVNSEAGLVGQAPGSQHPGAWI